MTRYHKLDVDGRGERQVVELLEKVEEMVAGWDRELLLEALEQSEERNTEMMVLCSEQNRVIQQMEEMIECHAKQVELLGQESEQDTAGIECH